MSYNYHPVCRKFTLLVVYLLLFQPGFAQYNFSKVDELQNSNLKEIGSKAVFAIYKDGMPVYNKLANDLSGWQKRIGKFIAKREGKDADEILQEVLMTFRLKNKG